VKQNLNRTVLMSGADYFSDDLAINPYMDSAVPINGQQAAAEHDSIRHRLEAAGVKIIQVSPPPNCQDGVYTANWALCRGYKAIVSRLPEGRRDEEPYAKKVLADLGKNIIEVPDQLRFSGQGDALPCGDYLFAGSGYRTDRQAHQFVGEQLGYTVISLQTIPERRWGGWGPRVTNKASGWPDSFFYDIDLALSILRFPAKGKKGLIAWCPAAFTRASQAILRGFDGVDKIEVTKSEAVKGFACNLVSTGETVIMSADAPLLKAAIEAQGLEVVTPEITELAKGGGYIRCTTLTLDND
jgi:N-dimethylarginine dimethylaminohydrolase